MSDEFIIRPMLAADEAFVYRAWLKGYWDVYPGRVHVDENDRASPQALWKAAWWKRYRAFFLKLSTSHGGVLVAHVEGEPASLLGFAASGHGCLHWAYVKQAFRGLGIATAMIRRLNLNEQVCSLWSPKLEEHGWRFDPRRLKGHV